MDADLRVPAHNLLAFTRSVFARAGLAPDRAADAADVLIWANRRGVDTHGLRNLNGIYLRDMEQRKVIPDAEYRIEYESPITARVDGGGALGLTAACWGMRLAIHKAHTSGIGLVAMRNSEHFGAAGYYPWMALSHDMIGIALTGRFFPRGASVGLLPTYAAVPMFSTNPIAIAFPTGTEPPILLDMATTVAPYNRVMMHKELSRQVPLGWGLDAERNPTADPAILEALLPLGGERATGGHKGYGLALMVETLCALLSGAWAPVQQEGDQTFEGYGQPNHAHFFGAIRVDAFRPVDEFKAGMDAMIRALHAAPKAPGHDRIYVAGEPEHDAEQERLHLGIPLPAHVVADLRRVALRYDVPFPA